jgi:hypothetical protein
MVLLGVLAATAPSGETSWPPALVYFAIGLLFASVAAVGTVLWRAHKTVRSKN